MRYAWGVLSKEKLKEWGYSVEWKSYRGLDHSANTAEINDLEAWLTKRVGRKGDGVL